MSLTAIGINCSLKRSSGPESSTDKMIKLVAGELASRGVGFGKVLRLADYNILPGVRSDEGAGDDWPELRRQILAADILVFGSPVWMGQLSSVGKRVLERMDAFLSETDDNQRTPAFGKVAVLAVVGNEDGAHCLSAQVYQALSDVGWTIPPQAVAYWVGEAMGKTDFKDLPEVPEQVVKAAGISASAGAHLASLLKASPYPGS